MENIVGEVELEKLTGANDAVVIDVAAEWCTPCKVVAPILEELEVTFADKIKFYRVDISKYAPEFIREMGIRSVPTILFYKKGVMIGKEIGFKDKNKIVEMVKKTLG